MDRPGRLQLVWSASSCTRHDWNLNIRLLELPLKSNQSFLPTSPVLSRLCEADESRKRRRIHYLRTLELPVTDPFGGSAATLLTADWQ
jgi:hypothetical protein